MLTNESDPMMELRFLEKDHWFQRQLLWDFGRETFFFFTNSKMYETHDKVLYDWKKKNSNIKNNKKLIFIMYNHTICILLTYRDFIIILGYAHHLSIHSTCFDLSSRDA